MIGYTNAGSVNGGVATLRVYANRNSQITVTDGRITKRGVVVNEYCDIRVPLGSLSVTADDGTYSGTDGINITAKTNYEINMNFKQNYQIVKYLQSSGSQWINLDNGFDPSTDELELNAIALNVGYLYGYYNSSSYPYIALSTYGSRWRLNIGDVNEGPLYSKDKFDEIKNIKGQWYINTVSYGNKRSTIVTDDCYLFKRHASSTEPISAKLSKITQKRGNEYLFDMIPCYRKSDNVAGLWDKVSKTLFTNNGTDTFIVGPNVN